MPGTDATRELVSVARNDERPMSDARRAVTGSTKGNKNALKHGRYTAEAIMRRKSIAELLALSQKLID